MSVLMLPGLYESGVSPPFQSCNKRVTSSANVDEAAERGRRVGFGEKRRDLAAQLVLEHVDLPPRVEHAEAEPVGHRGVLLQQHALVGAQALVTFVPNL